jgi:hypothetical protein
MRPKGARRAAEGARLMFIDFLFKKLKNMSIANTHFLKSKLGIGEK